MRQLSTAQWQWVIDRYREGYSLSALCRFLGLHYNTLWRILRRRGVIAEVQDEIYPLEYRRDEFEGLDDAVAEKKNEKPDNKFRYY